MARLPNTEGRGVSELRNGFHPRNLHNAWKVTTMRCKSGANASWALTRHTVVSHGITAQSFAILRLSTIPQLWLYQNLQLCGGETDWIFTRGHMQMEKAGNSTLLNHWQMDTWWEYGLVHIF
jgi:hypothetical protein